MTKTTEEQKAAKAAWAARAEYMKAYYTMRYATPEGKAAKVAYDARRNASPEWKAYLKAYHSTPEGKL